MENRCSVLGCLNTSDDGVRLHEFPLDDEQLLPIWIMVTNRSNWLPIEKSRICDDHFDIADYEAGNKANRLRPGACPIIHPTTTIFNAPGPANCQDDPEDITHGKILTDSEDSECSSTSDINSDDLLDTPNTSDMKSSDEDSTLSTSSCSNFSNSNEATGFDDDFLSSLSDTEFELENIDIEESMKEVDSVSLSSSVTSLTNQPINQECAVVLCNRNARDQFDTLFFINFPKDNKALCETWWKICGRKDKFDPLLKICSIHFDPEDFTSITIRRDGQLFRQTILKNNNIVPTLYLLSHEYTKFVRKRKRSVNDSYSLINNTTEFEYCIVQGCDKTFLKDGKETLFFKFPLENKNMLKKWVDSIGLTNWQPTDTDRICSDHFENDDVVMTNDIYGLNNDAIPSIKPQNSFVISSEDNYERKHASTVNSNIINHFNNLEFRHLKNDVLMVKGTTRGKMNESLLLNSLENDADDHKPENHQQIFNMCAVQSSSTKINGKKDGCNQFKLVSKPDEKTINENNLKNIHTDTSNITTISKNKSISKVVKKSYKESIEKNISEGKNMIPKSRNNGNDCDYIYLDMLDGDDAKNVLSFEKKSISKNSKTKILQLLEKNHTDGIPESIIYNQDLTECYGEMLSPCCDQDCQLICYYSMPGPDRRQIYKEFQMLNATEQNCKITQLVQLRISKKKDSTFESCPTYRFIWNKSSVKVCRTFFKNTLGISDNRLDAILKPINYSWYSDRDVALKANQPRQLNIINEPVIMTDFMKESLIPLEKDYNSYEPESEPEVSLENVPFKEYENVFLYMKGIPRVLSSYKIPGTLKKHFFETSIRLEYMYKSYSENFIRNKTPPPFTKRQFKKIYNQYMKTFLKMV
ncbi:uncharacterized protein LOC100167907 isoform X2 [Acyrthosiphon pisum]|uniref:THAP-type domain-containing protein n=1 Tax=Acyrthosiphon pisum TaxID=7029 RepID=A0A8R2F9S8_ACYPI|nr:uncharacterized protein LOC100167907 isoform X2 [Acyrthosiphon pisum]|eukprot:XP_001952638.1 PREDICTED: uncharacterized protein LOC100167907 isoform X1 [Acyrthosiphon pisum]